MSENRIKIGGRQVAPSAITIASMFKYEAASKAFSVQRTEQTLFDFVRVLRDCVFDSLHRAEGSITIEEVETLTPDQLVEAMVVIIGCSFTLKVPTIPRPN